MSDASNVVNMQEYIELNACPRTNLDRTKIDNLVTSYRIHEMVAAYRGDHSASRTWRKAAELLLEALE